MCPRPILDRGAEASADRILDDVSARFGEVALAFDASRGESVCEEVSEAAMSFVEPLSVASVQALKTAGELAPGGVEHQVIVRRHETEGVDGPAVGLDACAHDCEERAPVVIVPEDRAPIDPSRDHVEVTVRKRGAEDAWHDASTVGDRMLRSGRCGQLGALLALFHCPHRPCPGSDPGFRRLCGSPTC